MNDEEQKVILTVEQAKNLLPAKERIHTFRQAGPVLIGADWDKADLESEIAACTCELAGKQAQAMKHGLVVHTLQGPLFVETASA